MIIKKYYIYIAVCIPLWVHGIKKNEFPPKDIVVVIPSYNNQDWCVRNLRSVLNQDYTHYRVIYIDDCSSDGTYQLVQEFITGHPQGSRVTLLRNETRQRQLANHYQAVQMCKDTDIVVHLDGDDWFAHRGVLKKVNAAYQDPHVWLTYGQHKTFPKGKVGFCKSIPKRVIETNAYRYGPFITSHLRTFYAKLFKLIKTEDLLHPDGSFFQAGADIAFMFPMIEMAAGHAKFIPDVLYIYNRANVLQSSHTVQSNTSQILQQRTRYEPLSTLWER